MGQVQKAFKIKHDEPNWSHDEAEVMELTDIHCPRVEVIELSEPSKPLPELSCDTPASIKRDCDLVTADALFGNRIMLENLAWLDTRFNEQDAGE